MIPLATLAFKLLGIGKAIGRAVKARLLWALQKPYRAVIIALLVAVGVLAWQNSGLRHDNQRAAWREDGWRQFAYDVGYASKNAELAAIANAERVKQEYERIAENAKVTHNRALADNRAAIERWKLQNNRGQSFTGQGDSAATAEVSTGIAGAETLPVIPRGFVLLPESDLDKVAVIQAAFFALQQAAREAQGVETDPNKLLPKPVQ